MSPEQIAKICHQVNKAWCEYNGDMSQQSWEDAPSWQRDSAISGVNFHLGNPNAGDSASHDEWMRHKIADGWVYGETKNETNKTHPCIVPFEELPVEQQFKDKLFRTVVHASNTMVTEIVFPENITVDDDRWEYIESLGLSTDAFTHFSLIAKDDTMVGLVSDNAGHYFYLKAE